MKAPQYEPTRTITVDLPLDRGSLRMTFSTPIEAHRIARIVMAAKAEIAASDPSSREYVPPKEPRE